jgi:hypothetical protein
MIKVLRQQLELVPEDLRARILLAANLAYSEADSAESIRHLQTAVALRPHDPRRSKRCERLLQPATATAIGRQRFRSGLPHDDPNCRNWCPAARRLGIRGSEMWRHNSSC